TFRNHNTGEWMVGQINVLMALQDVGPGDGPTVLVPGSHKSTEIHPRLEQDGKGLIAINDHQAAGTALGMQEMYLNAGDVLFFTDTVTHGSAERTNPGHRRVAIYRYSPKFIRTRFNYEWSEGLLGRLSAQRRNVIEPIPRKRVGM
ncbi:MAG: phytanoyl-CoA dioxygenase family protein, partial [Caldilineaceae bacterium]|nr:phytanoyl-CoA dioxygenase family protein [Caldilineaceae bacterium]